MIQVIFLQEHKDLYSVGETDCLQCSFWSRSIQGGAFFSSLVDTTASANWHIIFQCSRNSPLKYFCSNPKNGGNWDRATFPPSSLAGGRRATEQNLRCSLGIERNMKPVSKEIQVWFSQFCINLSSDLHKSDCYSLKSERKKILTSSTEADMYRSCQNFLHSLFRL